MNYRLSVSAAVAVILASLSLSSVIKGANWFVTGIGAVAVVALAGILTRRSRLASAITATVAVLIAVVPLLSRPSWTDRAIGLVIVVVTALSATGARPLRSFGVLAGYLAFLLLYLNLAFAHSSSFGQLIPSYSSLSALGRLWRSAFGDFKYLPPVNDYTAVSLVAAAGIGAVAVAVDILAVRLRRPAVAGLPLLLLFSVPVASNLKVFGIAQMLIFAVSLAGYLGLLSADGRERLRMWGRLVTFRHVQSPDETGSGPDTRELAASGRRIGLAAVCLAIIIPVIVPTMHTHHLFATTAGGGTGRGTTAGVSPLLTVGPLLTSKPKQVLTYTTGAADPSLQYLQVYVLNYNARANQWLQLPHSRVLPVDVASTGGGLPWTAQGLTDTTPVQLIQTKVHISKDYIGPSILPIPYAPTHLDVHGDTAGFFESRDSLMVFNDGLNLAGLAYTVQSTEPNPREANIANLPVLSSIQAQYGSYDGPDRTQLRQIARARTAGATTPLQRAQDLESWFHSDFGYTLRPDLRGTHWLPTFLTTEQRGFCSQFAWAFAVLARLVGIPSRIAVGYTGGVPVPGSGDTWRVTTADAHAWPELYFTGEGWLRFEPTPTGPSGQQTAADPVYAGVDNTHPTPKTNPTAGQTRQDGSLPPSRKHLAAPGLEHGAGGGLTAGRHAAGSNLWLAIGIPVGVFLLIAWPALIRVLTRRRRWLSASSDGELAHAAWRELTDDLADFGLGFTPAETPRAVARRLTREADLDESGLHAVIRISAAEERARYARLPDPGAELKGSVRAARLAFSASVPRRQRLRARLLPASTLQAAGRLAQRAGEMFNWLDFSWPALRRQLRTMGQRPG
jgi:hypothetical protein